ncbi:MAG: ZIP family metal transporter [Candidatus Berkelbacteria bacterium]|nr:ZIP family metal transporter [Candidatus Berkelbacteria bacterium]
MVYLIGLAAVACTFLGGYFALRFKDKLHLILGFSAGAVIGVALLDLLPESIELSSKFYEVKLVTLLISIGFILFMIFDRMFSLHLHASEEHCENESHRGQLGAVTLSLHSFLDGLGIGLAFQVSPLIGWIVAAAVLAHDFSDGINTVNMILKNRGKSKMATFWLVVDALAPMAGILAASFIHISSPILGLILAVFTGFFLYLGASDLIPESHHHHPTLWTTMSTILGIATIYSVVTLAK